ncbi:methyltransferase [Streptomyces sp. KK5PA1]|uniref:Methyltransferase n=2 Tax=Actinacidiphila acididurans TaxID=2784346 RepID=A0ABS2U2V7_9ACTN|nr:methyltransferase [Actinacidiphila acididurans]
MHGLSAILFGHSAFQYLNAANELGLFEDLLAAPGSNREQVGARLGLGRRPIEMLLLGCTALRLLTRDADGGYHVCPEIRQLADDGDWQRFKDVVDFEQRITYEGQADFTESLRRDTNVGLDRIPGTGRDLYHRLTENPRLETVFYRYMRSWSELANRHLVEQVDLGSATSLLDCGGGDGVNTIALAKANPHLRATILEIEATAPITEKRIIEAGLADRVNVQVCEMFEEPFPAGHDTVLFAHQMVIWRPEDITVLLRKAYDALPEGGRVVIFNSMSDDTGDGPLIAALDSVYFACLPVEGGMIWPWSQHEECLREAGFSGMERFKCPTWTPHGIIVATK